MIQKKFLAAIQALHDLDEEYGIFIKSPSRDTIFDKIVYGDLADAIVDVGHLRAKLEEVAIDLGWIED